MAPMWILKTAHVSDGVGGRTPTRLLQSTKFGPGDQLAMDVVKEFVTKNLTEDVQVKCVVHE